MLTRLIGQGFKSGHKHILLQLKNCFGLHMHIGQEVIGLCMRSNLVFGMWLGSNSITCVSVISVLEVTGQGLR